MMATFRVGQRVKRIGGAKGADYPIVPAGAEGTITGGPKVRGPLVFWDVRWDVHGDWNAVQESLVPLSDPKADEFIERIKKLKPYEEPVAPRKTTAKDIVDAALRLINGDAPGWPT